MSKLTIFKDNAVATQRRPVSDLTKSVATNTSTRRIQTNTNGTFRRIVGGEQIGKAIRGEFNAIIVGMLQKPSRTFYAGKYDPDAKPTLPDCWSNDGTVPDAKASNKQAPNCANCPQNIVGSGENGKGRACRYQRRVALLLEGDPSGDAYQFNIPAKSLFGKGTGNTHPFESYVRFLAANEESIDYVVTNIAYNLEAETMELQFTPVRPITDDEYALVLQAQADPETQRLIQLTVAEADGVTKKPASKPVQEVVEEDEEEEQPDTTPAPKVAPQAKSNVWGSDEDEDEEQAEPVKRASRKPAATSAPAAKDISSIVSAWADEDD